MTGLCTGLCTKAVNEKRLSIPERYSICDSPQFERIRREYMEKPAREVTVSNVDDLEVLRI